MRLTMKEKNYNIGKIDIIILTLLRDNKELYGLEIQNEIKKKQNRTIALATIYYSLKRLKRLEYITVSRYDKSGSNRGGRPKTYFRINDDGRGVLNQYVEDMENIGLFSPSLAMMKVIQILKRNFLTFRFV